MLFFTKLEKSTLWKHKRLQTAKAILSKESNAGVISRPDFKLYCKAIVIKNSTILAQKQTQRTIEQKIPK
jgi:hypothetical protein